LVFLHIGVTRLITLEGRERANKFDHGYFFNFGATTRQWARVSSFTRFLDYTQ